MYSFKCGGGGGEGTSFRLYLRGDKQKNCTGSSTSEARSLHLGNRVIRIFFRHWGRPLSRLFLNFITSAVVAI